MGRVVLASLRDLERPTYESLRLHTTEVLGISRDQVTAFLNQVQEVRDTTEAGLILQKVRDKQTLVEIANAVGEQLASGDLDIGGLNSLLHRDSNDTALASVSQRLDSGFPDPPNGLKLVSLPRLTEATGGIIGMWAVDGEPGIGKSTLGWQIALDVGRVHPVLYYDFENGWSVMMDHTRTIFKGDLARARTNTQNIYHRDSIRTLERDLASVPAPALIVIDSIQGFPGSVEFKKNSLDRWLRRLEALKKRGYSIVLISEVGRAHYGTDASIASFKESGEIEYVCDAGIQMIQTGGDTVNLVLVKNRHRKAKGDVGPMKRYRDFMWAELEAPITESEVIN